MKAFFLQNVHFRPKRLATQEGLSLKRLDYQQIFDTFMSLLLIPTEVQQVFNVPQKRYGRCFNHSKQVTQENHVNET